MKYDPLLISVVRPILERLVREEYESVISMVESSRLTAEDLRNVVDEYGRTLVIAKPGQSLDLSILTIHDYPYRRMWSVYVPLWTREEGRSDLTLDLTVRLDAGGVSVELKDLHVL